MLHEDATSLRFSDISEVIGMMVIEITEKPRPLIPIWSVRLVHVLCRLMSTEAETSSVRRLVRALVHTGYRTRVGGTVLHLAVDDDSSSTDSNDLLSDQLSPVVVELLLEAGAAVNAVDCLGNTPLHLAVFKQTKTTRGDDAEPDDCSKITDVLLQHGAHIDAANAAGQTVCDLLPPSVVFNHVNLKCLAARVVRAYRLRYRDTLPTTIADFVDIH